MTLHPLNSRFGDLLRKRGFKPCSQTKNLVAQAFPDNQYKCLGVAGRWAVLETKNGDVELPSLKTLRRAVRHRNSKKGGKP